MRANPLANSGHRAALALCYWALLVAGGFTARAGEPHPSLPPPVIPDCLGVNIHFTDPQPGELEMLAAAGFKWVRMDLTWAATERQKGEYDFSAYDRLVAALDKFKIRAVFILDYGNPLYADPGDAQPFTSRAHTPEFREAFGKWAVAAVQHFKGRGYLWEMWNEPNGGFWKSPDKTGDYIALAKATGEALRKAGLLRMRNAEVGMRSVGEGVAFPGTLTASPTGKRNQATPAAANDSAPRTPNSAFPGEAFIGPATSTIDLPYLEACFQAGLLDYWDAVSVHPYRKNAPESVEDEYRSVRLLIRKYAPKDKVIPIISGEWGYSSAWPGMGKDEAARAEQQGKYLPRQFLTNIANDVALSIWYDWHDDGTDPKEGEHRFGVVSHEYHAGRDPVYDPKPAYTAMKTLREQLGGYEFNKACILEPASIGDGSLLLFKRKDEYRAVVWKSLFWDKERDKELPRYVFFLPRAVWRGVDIRGTKISDDSYEGDQVTLGFDQLPAYFSTVGQSDLLTLMAACPRLPLEMVWHWPVHDPDRDIQPAMKEVTVVKNPLGVPIIIRRPHDNPFEKLQFPGLVPNQEVPLPNIVLPPGGRATLLEKPFCYVPQFVPAFPVCEDRIPGIFDYGQNLVLQIEGTHQISFKQHLRALCANPLIAYAATPGRDFLPVRVENPSGEPFDGFIFAHQAYPGTEDTPVYQTAARFLEGEREKNVRIPIPNLGDEGHYWIFATGANEPPAPMKHLEIGDFHFRRLQIHERLEWVVNGDAKVQGDVTVASSPVAADLPPGATSTFGVKYKFGKGWKFLLVTADLPAMQKPESYEDKPGFGLWARGDGKGCQARVRFTDSTGQTFQSDGPKIDWIGWRFITFSLQTTDEKPLAHWGGANDGVIHYPIEWDSIFLLDNVSRQAVEGEIYLSAPTLIY